MRIFSFPRIKPDTRCVIALISTALLAIICGIVLCKTTQINPYMQNYASEYVYFVYNFRNASLVLPHLFHELVYGYAFFVIAYCTRFRLFAIPLLFLKCMITGVYTVLIVSVSAFGGTLAAVFVFIPVSLVSIFFNLFLIEACRFFNKKAALCMPAVFALAVIIAELLLLNVVFRVILLVA